MNLPIVYVDMDGVIADLDGGMADTFNINISRHDAHAIEKGKLFGTYLPEYVAQNMFEDQPTLMNSKVLVAGLLDLKEQGLINVAINTSTGYFYRPISEVRFQKSKFIEKHFPGLIDLPFCTTTSGRDKAILAHPKAFLIDDHSKNVERFYEAGGHGFIYNAEEDTCARDALRAVKKFLDYTEKVPE